MRNVIKEIYYRRPRGPQKRGACSKLLHLLLLLIRHWLHIMLIITAT